VSASLLRALVASPASVARSEPEALRTLAANPRIARTLRNEASRALATACPSPTDRTK
jgi:hypothetical protein